MAGGKAQPGASVALIGLAIVSGTTSTLLAQPRCPAATQHIQLAFIHIPKCSGSTLQSSLLPSVFNASGPCFRSSAVAAPGSDGASPNQIISGVFRHQTYESIRRQTNCSGDVWSRSNCSRPFIAEASTQTEARARRSRARLRSFLGRKREVVLYEDGDGEQRRPPDCLVLGTFLANPLHRFVSSYFQFARGDVWARRGVLAEQNQGFERVSRRNTKCLSTSEVRAVQMTESLPLLNS